MSAYSKVTISLPSDLLQAVDKKLSTGEETRSSVIRRLIENALKDVEEREAVAQFIKGWQENPQTEEEFGLVDYAVVDYAKDNPY
jgi:metal-responsive CopG/Arc/MetJ family transcriptional regulator